MLAAWTEELRRVGDEAVRDAHAVYVEDKAHLNFDMSEIQHFAKEVDDCATAAKSAELSLNREKARASRSIYDLNSRVRAQQFEAATIAQRVQGDRQMDKEKIV